MPWSHSQLFSVNHCIFLFFAKNYQNRSCPRLTSFLVQEEINDHQKLSIVVTL